MMYLGVYIAATIAQLIAAFYALQLYLSAKTYRVAAGFSALGFGLMLGRRIYPVYQILGDGFYHPLDAFLSLVISLLLLCGIYQVKKVWEDLEQKNFLLDQNLKLDSLTGVLSRSEVFYRAQIEIARSLRAKNPISFFMIDIDHFKVVNDSYGHTVGDVVLKNLANICQQELRAIDIFGRVGGEEFLAVLSDTDIKRAQEVAERLRSSVEKAPCGMFCPVKDIVQEPHHIYITISIGVAEFDPSKDDGSDALQIFSKYYSLCDQAMYQAKQSGRNRIAVC